MLLLSFVLLLAPLPTAPSCLLPPVEAPVVDVFREPPCPWCPGNRGLTYDPVAGSTVRATASGVVTFSGSVAGTRYVVLEHADGVRATYGGLADTAVRGGDVVAAGAPIGRTGAELHFGLRRGETYLDPAPVLGRLVERIRLVPADGTRPRAAPPPRLRCGAVAAG